MREELRQPIVRGRTFAARARAVAARYRAGDIVASSAVSFGRTRCAIWRRFSMRLAGLRCAVARWWAIRTAWPILSFAWLRRPRGQQALVRSTGAATARIALPYRLLAKPVVGAGRVAVRNRPQRPIWSLPRLSMSFSPLLTRVIERRIVIAERRLIATMAISFPPRLHAHRGSGPRGLGTLPVGRLSSPAAGVRVAQRTLTIRLRDVTGAGARVAGRLPSPQAVAHLAQPALTIRLLDLTRAGGAGNVRRAASGADAFLSLSALRFPPDEVASRLASRPRRRVVLPLPLVTQIAPTRRLRSVDAIPAAHRLKLRPRAAVARSRTAGRKGPVHLELLRPMNTRRPSVRRVVPGTLTHPGPAAEPVKLRLRRARHTDAARETAAVEQQLTRTVLDSLKRTVETVVQEKIQPGSREMRRLADRIHSDLYDQMIIERERLGWRGPP